MSVTPLPSGLADLFGSVGNTPLIRLPHLSAALGRNILGKAEFQNPGGSVKDRAARAIIEDAEASGRLKPGGILVEGTAGNTGIALAMLGNARGYRSIIVVPDNQAEEKLALLRTYGADLRTVPAAPFTDEKNYYHVARRIAEQTPGAVWADQFNNTANRRGHERTTGPEIWDQVNSAGGKIAAFVAAAGTGGTIAGVSTALKARDANIKTVVVDPDGSSLYAFVKHGTLDFEGDSITEGIGIRRVTENFRGAPVDDAIRIDDRTMIEMAFYLIRVEGLLVGGSAALNVAAAARIAMALPENSTVVTILCDGGGRYMSKLYNEDWLAKKGLLPKARDLDFLRPS